MIWLNHVKGVGGPGGGVVQDPTPHPQVVLLKGALKGARKSKTVRAHCCAAWGICCGHWTLNKQFWEHSSSRWGTRIELEAEKGASFCDVSTGPRRHASVLPQKHASHGTERRACYAFPQDL